MSNAAHIRPLAICLFTFKHRILVAEYFDPVKAEKFFRPIGGGIEFGEYAVEAVAREVFEELGAAVRNVRYLYTLENLFEFNGARGHEIVLVHDGAFVDESLYTRDVLFGRDTKDEFEAYWKSLDELRDDSRPLYPDGLLERLSQT